MIERWIKMSTTMLITQALDERDLLKKKIMDKINKGSFVDTIKRNEKDVYFARIERKNFEQEAQSLFQQIQDLIKRYDKIEGAIVHSNAVTYIETSEGKISIAEAIALRKRLKETAENGFYYESDFENALCNKLKKEYDQRLGKIDLSNTDLADTAERMRLSILGKESKIRDDKPLEVVEEYIKENTCELVDPIKIQDVISKLTERKDSLLRELETQIKVSNATTIIEI